VAVTARSRRQVEASGQAVASCSSGGPVEIAAWRCRAGRRCVKAMGLCDVDTRWRPWVACDGDGSGGE
jgi:hypothetical protein